NSGTASVMVSSLGAGSHQVTAVYTSDNPQVTGSQTVTPLSQSVAQATLTVTASNAARLYGAADPPFTAMITAFVNGGTLATSDVTGSPSVTAPAPPTSAVGTVTITAAHGTLASTNYTFTFVTGTLTINKAHLTVKADNQNKTYDGAAFTAFTVSF